MVALFAIIFLAAFIRLYGIWQEDVFFWDAARSLNEARWLLGDRGLYMEGADFPASMKTAYVAMVAFTMHIVGKTVFAGALVSAIFGTLSVALIYFLGKAIHGETAGLFAALIMAVMPLHVLLSRIPLTETTCIFFYVLAIFIYVKYKQNPKKSLLILCGLSAGLSFASKEFGLLALFTIFALEGYELLRRRANTRKVAFELAVISAAFLFVFFSIWAISNIAGIDFLKAFLGRLYVFEGGRIIIDNTPLGQLDRVDERLTGRGLTELGLGELALISGRAAVSLLSVLAEAPLIIWLLFFAAVAVGRGTKQKANYIVALWLAVCLIFIILHYVSSYNLADWKERHVAFAIPPLALVGGLGAEYMIAFSRRFRPAFAAIFAALLVLSIPPLIGYLLPHQNAWREAAHVLLDNSVSGTITEEAPILSYYTSKISAPAGNFSYTKESLGSIDHHKYDYIVVTYPRFSELNEHIVAECDAFKTAYGARIYKTAECLEILKKRLSDENETT